MEQLPWDSQVRLESGQDRNSVDRVLAARALVDHQAFAELYARYVDTVYAFCRRRMHSPVEAEDATSQVFCKALAELPRYRGGSFAAWLFSIARSVNADHFRRRRPEQAIVVEEQLVDGTATPEEYTLITERERWVETLLAHLPADQRHVVELRLAGFTGVEIAQVLGKSLGAVKMLQFRAAGRLRSLTSGKEQTEEAQHART